MDIHKPKPFHGLREFLKEYGIIVLGVLTALALEQAVEAIHWREQAEQSREALSSQVKDALLDASERLAVAPCITQRLVLLRDSLLTTSQRWQGRPEALPGLSPLVVQSVLRAPTRSESTNAWSSALAGNTLNHMPKAEVQAFDSVFYSIGKFNT